MANFHQSITPSRNHRHHRQGYRRESSHWHHRQDDRRESSHWQLQPPQVFLFTTPTSSGRPTKLYPFTASTSLHPVITVFDLGGIERDDEYLGGSKTEMIISILLMDVHGRNLRDGEVYTIMENSNASALNYATGLFYS